MGITLAHKTGEIEGGMQEARLSGAETQEEGKEPGEMGRRENL